jgi:hypothetical protein
MEWGNNMFGDFLRTEATSSACFAVAVNGGFCLLTTANQKCFRVYLGAKQKDDEETELAQILES